MSLKSEVSLHMRVQRYKLCESGMSCRAACFPVGKCFGAPGDVILKGFLMVSQLEYACWALKLYAQSHTHSVH